ncbi:MAG: GntR family transcriptional regulator [Pleomorphochaeta sp.]
MSNSNNNLADEVYSTLRNKILDLEYKPGKSISVASVANKLNISRSPVREAILRLNRENLIEIFPQSGSRISLIDIKNTEEERFVRRALEIEALNEMLTIDNSKSLKLMKECLIEQEKYAKAKNSLLFTKKDNEFHNNIFKSIKKEKCWNLINDFTPNEFRVRLLAITTGISPYENVIQNHKDLILAIENRNLERAIKITQHHLEKISTELVILISRYPELFNIESTKDTKVPSNIRIISSKEENFLEKIREDCI